MAITGSGYDRDAGGAQGKGFTGGNLPYQPAYASAGVSIEKWLSWSYQTQLKWLEDYNRTPEQQTYAEDSDYAKVYNIKEWVDETLVDPLVELPSKLIDTTKTGINTALVIGALYLALR